MMNALWQGSRCVGTVVVVGRIVGGWTCVVAKPKMAASDIAGTAWSCAWFAFPDPPEPTSADCLRRAVLELLSPLETGPCRACDAETPML